MNNPDTKRAIENSLKSFATTPFAGAAIALFEALGYRSEKRLALKPNTADSFLNIFGQQRALHRDQASWMNGNRWISFSRSAMMKFALLLPTASSPLRAKANGTAR